MSAPVDVLKAAHAGLLLTLKDAVFPVVFVSVGLKVYVEPAVMTPAGEPLRPSEPAATLDFTVMENDPMPEKLQPSIALMRMPEYTVPAAAFDGAVPLMRQER